MNHVQVDKQLKLEDLFQQHYDQLRDLTQEDPRLLIQDADNILEALPARLNEYDGELTDEDFLKWASSVITPAAERILLFYQWRHECCDSVMSGIWSILSKNLDLTSDPTAVAEMIEQNTWHWVIAHIDALLIPGPASLNTRLYAQARCQALTWRKSCLRALKRFDDSDVERYGRSEITELDESGNITTGYCYLYDTTVDDETDEPARPQTINLPIPSPSDSLIAMRSGTPRLLCPVCKSMEDISPDPPASKKTTRLVCGHERPALLPEMAAALKE